MSLVLSAFLNMCPSTSLVNFVSLWVFFLILKWVWERVLQSGEEFWATESSRLVWDISYQRRYMSLNPIFPYCKVAVTLCTTP